MTTKTTATCPGALVVLTNVNGQTTTQPARSATLAARSARGYLTRANLATLREVRAYSRQQHLVARWVQDHGRWVSS